jgi:hypothetical protein
MKRLTGSKKVFAIASAILLVTAASGTALAMIDQGFGSIRSQQEPRQIQQNASGQAQQSPLPTSTPKPQGEVEFRGAVEVIAATGWVIGGRTVQVTGATEIGAGIDIGSEVKVHARVQADGSLLAREIELVDAGDDDGNSNGNGNENENDDNGNGNGNSNDNDDNGNGNSNDNDDDHDNGNGNGNSNDNDDDDHGNVNSNDDAHGNGNDDNDDDDHSNGNDDHDDNSNDDHGGNDND